MASAGAGGAGASRIELLDRVRACLWGMHIGDALAMPVHWYYDTGQLRRDFGAIKGYVAPKEKIPGSIMSLSNTGGGGRGDDAGTVVGEIILQGKRKYWSRGGNFHYHRGMAAGENTLEVTISRQCYMASLTGTQRSALDRFPA
jgi:ADP-ribosyl-[dinitrogen reductase] hydrolase